MICAEDNGIWDAAINMGFRMALSNYKPRQPPKYEYPEDVCVTCLLLTLPAVLNADVLCAWMPAQVDEFDRKRITEKTYDSQEEVPLQRCIASLLADELW